MCAFRCCALAVGIGFNYPHGIMKSGCSGWESSAGSTFYFKPGHVPPNIPPPPTSSWYLQSLTIMTASVCLLCSTSRVYTHQRLPDLGGTAFVLRVELVHAKRSVNNVNGLPYAVCMTRGIVNGTYKGTTCDGHCKELPKPPPLAQQLADFASAWQNETWTCVLPATRLVR